MCTTLVCIRILFVFVILLLVLSWGSIENILSIFFEVVVWSAYTLPSPDPTRWEYTRHIVVVVIEGATWESEEDT